VAIKSTSEIKNIKNPKIAQSTLIASGWYFGEYY
jgi:hypothetical protein